VLYSSIIITDDDDDDDDDDSVEGRGKCQTFGKVTDSGINCIIKDPNFASARPAPPGLVEGSGISLANTSLPFPASSSP